MEFIYLLLATFVFFTLSLALGKGLLERCTPYRVTTSLGYVSSFFIGATVFGTVLGFVFFSTLIIRIMML